MKKIYLAIPYTGMTESSFKQANEAAAVLLNEGYNVFSPISHCHIITREYNLPTNWNFWKKVDFQFIDWADEVWVLVPKEGWHTTKESNGVQAEIKYALSKNKAISFFMIENNKIKIFVDDELYRRIRGTF
jgi:nucleoside 2-deoxyribosyltransferase